jgi:superfamily II DNA/RNA helicase
MVLRLPQNYYYSRASSSLLTTTPTRNHHRHQQQHRRHLTSFRLASTATTASSSSTSTSTSTIIDNLENLTVKELKQLLEEHELNERGLLSKLKRKQDLVTYLQDHLPIASEVNNNEEEDVEHADMESSSEEIEIEKSAIASPEKSAVIRSTQHTTTTTTTQRSFSTSAVSNTASAVLSNEIKTLVPPPLQETMARKGLTSLLPIQSQSFVRVQSAQDTVLHAPTGAGKTLAYVLPLVARMLKNKNDVLRPLHKKGKHSAPANMAVSPRIITLVPSRELARQVGKEWSKFCEVASVATVFGGVPLERHTALLRKGGGAHVVVATPGRLRELVREGHLNYEQVHAVVLDEADTMLDAADSPEVQSILEDINTAVGLREDYDQQVYQLLLVSATVNSLVRDFASDIMEIETDDADAFIRVEGSESRRALPSSIASSMDKDEEDNGDNHPPEEASSTSGQPQMAAFAPEVHHWHMSAKTTAQPSVTADLISSLAPKLGIIFVQTKSETEALASFLTGQLPGVIVRTLHGDMSQPQRSRAIALMRETIRRPDTSHQAQILVATDVASRGLDLPNVELVVQLGLPRVAGKEGTYNVELYTHRTGRAGRAGGDLGSPLTTIKDANSIMLYDPGIGEGKILDDMLYHVKHDLGATVRLKSIPSSLDLVESGYERAAATCSSETAAHPDTVEYFRERLVADMEDPSDTCSIVKKSPRLVLEFKSIHHSPYSSLVLSQKKLVVVYASIGASSSDPDPSSILVGLEMLVSSPPSSKGVRAEMMAQTTLSPVTFKAVMQRSKNQSMATTNSNPLGTPLVPKTVL